MHKLVVIFFIGLFSIHSLNSQGIEYADSLFNEANIAYKNESYNKAVDLYLSVADTGYKSFELFYNLGNSYFKAGEYPKAILFYERALLINPADENAKFNLQKANAYTIDRIEMIPEFFLVSWFQDFISTFNTNTWAIIALVTFVTGLIFLLLYFISRLRQLKIFGFGLGIICLVFAVLSYVFSVNTRNYLENSARGIIMTPTVTVKGAPDENGVNVFIIHEGTKVNILRSIGEWSEIKLADGKQGWLLHTDMEKI